MNVDTQSHAPYVVDMRAKRVAYVALLTAVQSQRRKPVGAELVLQIFISPVIPLAFRVLLLMSRPAPRVISSTAHVPPHSLPRILSADMVRPLEVASQGTR